MNTIILTGNVTAKPILNQGAKTSFTRFRIAVRRGFSEELTDFFEVIAYGKQAELVTQYTDKGSKVLIKGMLTTSDYETRTGERRTGYAITADNVEFLSRQATESENNNGLKPIYEEDEEKMPF